MKPLKIGLLVVGVLAVGTLLTLRVTGLPPGHPSAGEYAKAGRSARPGLWLTGEVVHEAVTNWDWVNEFSDPFSKNATELEARNLVRYPPLRHGPTGSTWRQTLPAVKCADIPIEQKFPHSKAWWRNVERDPRVRLKIGGKIYEMTVALVQDRVEVARLRGERDPVVKEAGADGNEHITEEWHYWRVFQRNVPEYGIGSAVAASDSDDFPSSISVQATPIVHRDPSAPRRELNTLHLLAYDARKGGLHRVDARSTAVRLTTVDGRIRLMGVGMLGDDRDGIPLRTSNDTGLGWYSTSVAVSPGRWQRATRFWGPRPTGHGCSCGPIEFTFRARSNSNWSRRARRPVP